MSQPLLAIEDLTIGLPSGADRDNAVENVSLDVRSGEILCVVGESGSGKSMTASAVMGLVPKGLPVRGGRIMFEGQDLLSLAPEAMRRLRGARLGMVFQEPMTALNPLMRVGEQIGEAFAVHGQGGGDIRARVLRLLEDVRLPDPPSIIDAYPFRLSGGQRQRVMIAMALALSPSVLVADEPTTALDVTTQMQILRLVRGLQKDRGTGVLFITHDFGVVAEIADRVAVMQHGRVVEEGQAQAVLDAPQHPYTRALIAAVPHGRARPAEVAHADTVLAVRGVGKSFRRGGGFFRRGAPIAAVADAEFTLTRGETLGLVGESGSGKSTLARCVVRLMRPEQGSIAFHGTDLMPLGRAAMQPFRKRIQMVFQDPYASLNPRRRVGDIIAEGPVAHGMARAEALQKARDLLALVQLDPGAMERYPHEFSGGQRQRIGIARALALEPELLIADEPVSALDVSVQAQILELLDEIRRRLGLTMLFITHDLRVAAQVCDRIAVMQHGRIVEIGPTGQVFGAPSHPYTRELLDAIPGRGWTPPVSPPVSPPGQAA